MSKTVSVAFEFDSYPGETGRVELREDGMCSEVVLCLGNEQASVIKSDRDQWGVWHTVEDTVIAQEDGTRSFVDALIQCLTILKERSECQTVAATKTIG
jgi:hypothetical protein